MTSMTACLLRHAKELKDFDKESVVEAAAEYKKRGEDDHAANIKAVEDHLDGLREERNRIVSEAMNQFKASHPKRYAEMAKAKSLAAEPGAQTVTAQPEGVPAVASGADQLAGVPPSAGEATAMTPGQSSSSSVPGAMSEDNTEGQESRAGYSRDDFARNALFELAFEDDLFRYKVSKAGTLQGVMRDVFPGAQYVVESTRDDEKTKSGADHRYTFLSPDTPAKDGRPEVKGKQFDVFVTRDRVWVDFHWFQPGDQGSRAYAAVANFAYNTRRVFGGDPAGVSPAAVIARTKMMLSSSLRFGTTRHLEPSVEQERGIPSAMIPPLAWKGSDVEKTRSLLHTFLETVQNNAPSIKNYSYDFQKRRWINNSTGLEFRPSRAAFDAALGEGQRRAAGVGPDSGRLAIFIQSLVRGRGGEAGDGGILEAILNHSRSLIEEGGLRGMLSKKTPSTDEVSVSAGKTLKARAVQGVAEKFRRGFRGAEALDVRVVDSRSDIPRAFRPSPYAEGVFHDSAGRIYLIAENLPSVRRAWQVLLHEAVGHYGLSHMMGPEFKPILKRVYAEARAKGDSVLDVKPGDADYATVEAVTMAYPFYEFSAELQARNPGRTYTTEELRSKHRDVVAQEVLARMAETSPTRLLLGYAKMKIREWANAVLRAMGVSYQFQANELNDLIVQAAAYLRSGKNLKTESRGDGMAFASKAIRGGTAQTETPEFKKWFGKSAVVDSEGKPLVMYHGTTNAKQILDSGFKAGWVHLTDSQTVADSYQEWKRGDSAGTLAVYVKAENPAYYDAKGKKYTDIGNKVFRATADAERAGHDALIITNIRDHNDSSVPVEPHTTVVAFHPEQIKSIGNRGTFDPNSANILESRAAIIGDSGRTYTPEQQRAFEATGRTVQKLTPKERIAALMQDAGKKMAQGIVDQFAPVKDIDQKAYTLLRLSKGATGAFEALMHHGKLSLRDGAYDADTSGGVLEKVFYPLGKESSDFLYWIAGNRAEKLAAEGRENLFSAADIAAYKSLDNGVMDFDYTLSNGKTTRDRTLIYRDALAKFNEFNKNVLDMAEQSGLIDGASRAVWESEFYVPFYRVADDQDGGVRGMNVKQGVVRQEAFKKLKGGTDGLNDLMSNTLMNWAHLIDASAKNRGAKATLESAEKLGAARKAIHGEKKTVWFMDNGRKSEYKVEDPYLLTAIQGLEYAGLRGPAMQAMSAFKHWLTIGVTASPFFKVRNLIRDSMQAIAVSDLNPNPLANVAEGYRLTDRERQEYVSALSGGGLIRFGTMLEGNEASRTRQLIKKGAKDAHILDSESKVRAFYDKWLEPAIAAYNELGNRGEEINRMALYDQLIKKGVDHATANLMARDLMDFSMQGAWTSIRFLTQVVPFMNARLQGLYKLGRSAKQNPQRFTAVLGTVTLASLALLAAYSDDDDWKKREEWDRDTYWWFKFGGMAFRIPKPFEIGAMATLAERSAEYLFDNEMTGKRFRERVTQLLSDQLSMNPVPQLVKPIIDIYANRDSFTGRPIETMGMERLEPEYRFRQGTSMVSRGISTAGNTVTGGNFFSPVQVDHLVRGYFSWLGAFAVGSADMAIRAASDEPTKPALDYWKTATGGMAAGLDSASSRYVSQMYEQAKELEQAYGTWRDLLKQGRTGEAAEYRAEHQDELRRHRGVETVKRLASRLNERIRMIERSNLEPEQKREAINRVRSEQDRIARRLAPDA